MLVSGRSLQLRLYSDDEWVLKASVIATVLGNRADRGARAAENIEDGQAIGNPA